MKRYGYGEILNSLSWNKTLHLHFQFISSVNYSINAWLEERHSVVLSGMELTCMNFGGRLWWLYMLNILYISDGNDNFLNNS